MLYWSPFGNKGVILLASGNAAPRQPSAVSAFGGPPWLKDTTRSKTMHPSRDSLKQIPGPPGDIKVQPLHFNIWDDLNCDKLNLYACV